MKIQHIGIALCAVVLCAAQERALVEPDFADIFYRLDAGKMVALERQSSVTHGNVHGFIVMSMKTATEFPGARSSVRFAHADTLDFIVKLPFGGFSVTDPGSMFSLRRLNGKKKTRELIIMSGTVVPFSMNTKTSPSQGVLPVEFAKYGSGSIKITSAPLPLGEYALTRLGGQSAFCFGID